jgi:hypothetical protein
MDAKDVSKRTQELVARSRELRAMTKAEVERSRLALEKSYKALHNAGNILNRLKLRQEIAARRAALGK